MDGDTQQDPQTRSKRSRRGSTCFCHQVQRGDSGLEAPRTEVQADGERLASAHNQSVHAVQIRAVVHVVEQVLQVPAVDVQSFVKEKETKNESGRLVDLKSLTYSSEINTPSRNVLLQMDNIYLQYGKSIL